MLYMFHDRMDSVMHICTCAREGLQLVSQVASASKQHLELQQERCSASVEAHQQKPCKIYDKRLIRDSTQCKPI